MDAPRPNQGGTSTSQHEEDWLKAILGNFNPLKLLHHSVNKGVNKGIEAIGVPLEVRGRAYRMLHGR